MKEFDVVVILTKFYFTFTEIEVELLIVVYLTTIMFRCPLFMYQLLRIHRVSDWSFKFPNIRLICSICVIWLLSLLIVIALWSWVPQLQLLIQYYEHKMFDWLIAHAQMNKVHLTAAERRHNSLLINSIAIETSIFNSFNFEYNCKCNEYDNCPSAFNRHCCHRH